MIAINKTIQQVKHKPSFISYPMLDRGSLYLLTYTDASFNNLQNGGSQAGHLTLLCDQDGNCVLLSWNAYSIKRVVRSTLAAETIALMDGCDAAFLMSKMIQETFHNKPDIQSVVITDNQSLYNTVNTTHLVDNKRLRVELSAIRQLVANNVVTIQWTEHQNQLSDVLTKKGASSKLLLSVLQNGKTITNK